jgi:hypothetical protein
MEKIDSTMMTQQPLDQERCEYAHDSEQLEGGSCVCYRMDHGSGKRTG